MYSKNAIIFGSTGDLGSDLSKHLLLENYKLILTYKNNKKRNELEKKLNVFKGKYHLLKCDLENEISIKKTINLAKKKLKNLDLVVNTCGIFNYDNLHKLKYENILPTFKVNALSLIIINKELKKNFKKKKLIKVISIGSSSSLNGFKNTIVYCGSKHALLGIIKSLNETLYKDKIINYCLNTGSIKNKMGKKVRGQNFSKFIDQKEIIKAIQFIINIDPPGIPQDLYIKRFV